MCECRAFQVTLAPMCASKRERASSRRRHKNLPRISTGPGRLAEPLEILLGNRSLTWLVVALGTLTIAEWGYVTALAVDAFRREGNCTRSVDQTLC